MSFVLLLSPLVLPISCGSFVLSPAELFAFGAAHNMDPRAVCVSKSSLQNDNWLRAGHAELLASNKQLRRLRGPLGPGERTSPNNQLPKPATRADLFRVPPVVSRDCLFHLLILAASFLLSAPNFGLSACVCVCLLC